MATTVNLSSQERTPLENPFPIPLPEDYNHDRQAVEDPGTRKPGQTGHYRSTAFPTLTFTDPRHPKTAYECFNLGLRSAPLADCLGRRPWDPTAPAYVAPGAADEGKKGNWAAKYVWESYEQVDGHRNRVGAGLKVLERENLAGQVGSGEQWAMGVWCVNRPEWQYAQLASASQNLILVSLYDTLGPTVVQYCINHAAVRVVFASSAHIPQLLEIASHEEGKTLKVIVSVDTWASGKGYGATGGVLGGEEALKKWGASKGVRVLDIEELEAIGHANMVPHNPPKPQDIASICYTSGTTGMPKGVVLRHSMLGHAAVSNLYGSSLQESGVFFSYLPLSHIYERFCEDVAFTAGAAIGYTNGDSLRLLEDIQILQPTYFASVPRVLNRVYQSIKASTIDAPGVKGSLTRKAFADKLYNLDHKNQITHAFWDRIVFRKVRAALGGRIKFIGTGSAPINPDVLKFLKVAFSCEVTEGYGQTENCGTAVKCVLGDHQPAGTVGPPGCGVEVKLVDVPDMNYLSTDNPPRGELCTRGGMVLDEYYKDPEKTKETVDAEGWLHSGDIASVDEKGRFKIIDRIKNLIKLSQGEYVAVEKVENIYGLCPLIMQIYVHADSLQDHVVGLIVPDPTTFAPFASRVTGTTVSPTDPTSLKKASKDPRVISAMGKELGTYATQAKLNSYEKIGEDLTISWDPFTMENDMLTPTMKTKRNAVGKHYAEELKALYGKRPVKFSKL